MVLFGVFRRCFVDGCKLLEPDFESLKICAISSSVSLLHDCGSRVSPSLPASGAMATAYCSSIISSCPFGTVNSVEFCSINYPGYLSIVFPGSEGETRY